MNAVLTMLLDRLARWVCGRELWTKAQKWVALYESADLTGAEKRERVLNALQEEFTALGKDLMGFALEAALQYIRRRSA